jgi:O-antigen/teichoic acid export membrane protein
LIALAILALSVAGGWLLARTYAEPEFTAMLPVAMISIFFTGHTAILLALARRLRRFNDVAYASLLGHIIGIVLSLAIAWMGGGLWSLIANRLLIVAAIAVILQWRLGFLILPRWSLAHIGELGRFAGVSFLDRLTDNMTYVVFNIVVEALYGSTILGYVNMAMRLIEPIRGAIAATGHNLAFSFFAPISRDRARLGKLAESVVSRTALIVAPTFIGMAAVTPTLLPLVAGPGWDDAIEISACLAIGCAISSPTRLIYTALSASARPEFALLSTFAGFVVTLCVLVATSMFGPISVGVSRIAGDMARAGIAVGLTSPRLAWPRRRRLAALIPAWAFAIAMGLVVAKVGSALPAANKGANLAFLVMLGAAVYTALLALFARPMLLVLASLLGFRRRRPAVAA